MFLPLHFLFFSLFFLLILIVVIFFFKFILGLNSFRSWTVFKECVTLNSTHLFKFRLYFFFFFFFDIAVVGFVLVFFFFFILLHIFVSGKINFLKTEITYYWVLTSNSNRDLYRFETHILRIL